MKLIAAFFRLIRSVNLLFIVLTQCLFQYFIVIPLFHDQDWSPALPAKYFALLCFSSVCIAAAGYIINDYFDLNIDRINKPDRLLVDKVIRRRWAILWHWALSFAGVLLGGYVGWKSQINWLGLANAGCVAALWFYSTIFKKKMLSGNIIIALLTAWVVLVVGFATHYRLLTHPFAYDSMQASKLLRLTFLYGGFAFIISLVREIIKDIEDMPGDAKYGCRTMPIVWGIQAAKMFAATWILILVAALAIVQVYTLQFGWRASFVYCAVFIILPLLLILRKLIHAGTAEDFRLLSKWVKIVMLTGILSMIFFILYWSPF
ncbi:MAG: geranylgeranylglycerol-phosphate geranylgeranyltransferase [Chitinophagaceae bacterium]|nr:geranylgeranylglycerol-phosphate geranylgeranyltransferase [Chitinophagaceae bacterium]